MANNLATLNTALATKLRDTGYAVWATGEIDSLLTWAAASLAPGIVADLDTPMFQFIGRVLGVAHNPGYPLYVLLTYPIAILPFGSLPYRINLFSAVCGALAVALVFLVARRLGCGRPASLAASLGLAFGQVFWSQAVIAEVYTLHAALVAGALLVGISGTLATRSVVNSPPVATLRNN